MATSLKNIASIRELLISVTIIFFIIIVFFNYLYAAKSNQLKEIGLQVKAVEIEKKALVAQIEGLRKKREQKELEVVPVVTTNTKILILKGGKKPEFVRITDFLEKLVDPNFRGRVDLSNVATAAIGGGSGFTKQPVSITAKGTFGQITRFLKGLDDVEALVSVDSIFMAGHPSGEKKEGTGMDAQIAVTLYEVEGLENIKVSEQSKTGEEKS